MIIVESLYVHLAQQLKADVVNVHKMEILVLNVLVMDFYIQLGKQELLV
jgi:hypothetical protein